MKIPRRLFQAIRPAACGVLVLTSTAAEKFVWTEGHGDLAVDFVQGGWRFSVEEGRETGSVIIRVGDVARHEIPALPAFSFLGLPADPIWIIPAVQTPGIPFLGINAEATPSGVFRNDRFELSLASVAAPGHLMVWTTSGTGNPNLLLNSRDGLTAADTASVPAGGHFHANWGFTAPGTYRAGFQASGVLADGTATRSDESIYTFEVSVLKSGEADLEVAFEEGALQFHVHDEGANQEYAPEHVALQASRGTWQSVPAGAAFSFLGQPGASIYVLPQTEKEGVLSLGLAAAEIAPGSFANDQVSLRLVSVEGPGHVQYYEIDPFGAPTLFLNSADGITAADRVNLAAGSHVHRHWSFGAPGLYRVTLQASATLAAGGEVTSAPATFLFEVMAPEFVDERELDFEVAFEEGALELAFHDHAAGRALAVEDVVLVLRPAAQRTVPGGAAFSFLGAAGASFYVVPQDETAGLPFLGIAGEEIASGLFTGDSIDLELISATGPGNFALYSVDTFGKPTVFMSSAGGISAADIFPIPAGSHTHLNWAFSQPGEYRISFKAAGTLTAGSQRISSETATLRFLVQDLPAGAAGPSLRALLVSNSRQLQITWDARAGLAYQLQSRSSVSDQWVNEVAPMPGSAGPKTTQVDIGTEVLKMFRLVELPAQP